MEISEQFHDNEDEFDGLGRCQFDANINKRGMSSNFHTQWKLPFVIQTNVKKDVTRVKLVKV